MEGGLTLWSLGLSTITTISITMTSKTSIITITIPSATVIAILIPACFFEFLSVLDPKFSRLVCSHTVENVSFFMSLAQVILLDPNLILDHSALRSAGLPSEISLAGDLRFLAIGSHSLVALLS